MQSSPYDLFAYPSEVALLTIDALDVIGRRVAQFARGQGTLSEASSMITEKRDAWTDALVATYWSFAFGRAAFAPIGALRCYSERVQWNQRRLSASAEGSATSL